MKKLLSVLAVALCLIIVVTFFRDYIEDMGSALIFKLEESRSPVELTDVGSPYKFYYNRLENIEKQAYNAILSEIYSMPESIDVPRIDTVQLDNVFWALLSDNPDLFFVGRCCTLVTSVFGTNCSVEYCIEKDEYEKLKSELDAVCGKVISSLTNPQDKWQTELEIHDYIVDNCEYRMTKGDYLCSSAYGALVDKAAACEGYSRAAKLLLDKAGIESSVLSGVSTAANGSGGAHMWNAVKLDGEYYYLDCTWDDPVSDNGNPVKIYSYFNINDETIAATHSDFSYDFKCTATAANYYIKTGRYFETYSRSDEKKLASIIASELDSGGNFVEVRFGSKKAYNIAVGELIKRGRIYNVLSETAKLTDVDISVKSITYYNDPSLLTLSVTPEKK